MQIIFVCLGNICRSPMAEYIMKDIALKQNLDIKVLSAGTSGEHDGEDMHYKTKSKLHSVGIKTSMFKSKKLSQALCDSSDLIVVMDEFNYKTVMKNYKNINTKIKKMTEYAKELPYDDVPDPWYSGNFDETYKILSLACANLANSLKSR